MNYEEFLIKFKDSELSVSKKNISFLEDLLTYFNYDFSHDDFKNIVYGRKELTTKFSKIAKKYYDAYNYLLSNRSTYLSETLLKNFYYLLTQKELEKEKIIKIQSKYYNFSNISILEKILETHFFILKCFDDETFELKTIISLMFLNYLLLSNNLTTLRFDNEQINDYLKVKDLYLKGIEIHAVHFLINCLSMSRVQSIDYYESLKPLTQNDIHKIILNEKKILEDMFNVKSIVIFGSFAKHIYRLDSDIDLLICYKDDMSYDDKIEITRKLKEFLYCKFNRFVDIHEIRPYIEEQLIRGHKTYIKIF